MHLGAANWNDTVLTCSFLSPALEYRVLTLGLENAVVVEGWNSICRASICPGLLRNRSGEARAVCMEPLGEAPGPEAEALSGRSGCAVSSRAGLVGSVLGRRALGPLSKV